MSCRSGFTQLSPEQFAASLGQRLVRTVDRLRDMQTKFGMRPYEVGIRRVRWTGGTRNMGEAVVVSETPILPTPRVQDLSTLKDVLEPVGMNEAGDLQVSEISGRYSEAFFRGIDAEGSPIGRDESVYWTIKFHGQDRGGTAEVRLFQLVNVPGYQADRFQWTVALAKVDATAQDRGFGDVL